MEFAAFVQADWKVTTKLNLGAGARYQAQTNLRDYNNLAPTFQIAYQPRTGTVLRAGGRLSYQTYNLGNTESLRRLDGLNHQVETVILYPSYPDPYLNGVGSIPTASTGSIRSLDPTLRAPYTINSAFTVEQNVKKGWRFSVSYDLTRGAHLIRSRNVNAPYPGTPLPSDLLSRLNSRDPVQQASGRAEVDRTRPLYPTIGNVYEYESAGDSFSKNVGFRLYTPNNFAIKKVGINGFFQYVVGWAYDNGSAVNQYDWRSDWSLSSFDTRHRFISTLNLRLPKASTLSFIVNANSGRPYSQTTGLDNNGDQSTNDRLLGVPRNSLTGPGSYNVNANFTKQFNLRRPESQKTAVAGPNPANPTQGQVLIGGPGGPVVVPVGPNASAAPGPKMAFSVGAQNLLNNTQLRGYSGVLTSPLYGKPTGAGQGRFIILGLNFTF